MARYTGRKATIEAYKRERKRVMGYIHELESLGVSVPKELTPKQGGKVKAPDVAKLKRVTKESIMRKSTIVINETSYTGKRTTEVYTGKDVERVVRREKTKRSREITEKIKSGEYYHDPRTGDIMDRESRQKIGHRKVTEKEKREYEERLNRKGVKPTPPKPEPVEPEELGGVALPPEEPVEVNENELAYTEFMNLLNGGLKEESKRSAEHVNWILEYIHKAEEVYKKEEIGARILEMYKMGYDAVQAIRYKDEVTDSFIRGLAIGLPIKGRDKMDMQVEDDTGYDTEEEYEE